MIRLISSDYDEVEYAHTVALTKGVFVAKATLGGALNAFLAFADAAVNALASYVTKAAKVEVTKVAADALAFAPGEKVYYNVEGAKASKTSTDVLIGYAKRAALAADTEVIASFDGSLGSVTLDELADVTISGPTSGQALKFTGTAWANAADAT